MYTRRTLRSQSGFSLAEALVATAVFAILFIAALLVYDRSNRVFKSGVEAADMQQNTRVAFDKLVADVRLAGFDYDRDGVPTASGQFQQPDEQLEYAGKHALTLRANFNYGAANAGRETALEGNFPIVTTGNGEIVTYALVPDAAGASTDTITFYADVTDGTVAKRQSFPGGSAEDTVTITGVDLCDNDINGDGTTECEQPPYTLYRFTVGDNGTVERTPLASNIRSLQFDYYSDSVGTTTMSITDPGGGQVNPNTASTFNHAARTKRAEIKAIRVTLRGMNESGDPGWTQAGEKVASVKNRRQYTLESLIIPRNLGKRGMREQQLAGPGKPVLESVCFNYCGLVKITWEPPAFSITEGDVETYHLLWDTDTAKTPISVHGPPVESKPVGLATTAYLSGLDPTVGYRFSIAATNSYGTTYADDLVIGTPKNNTKPDGPTLGVPTGGEATPDPQPNFVGLSWTLPTTNAAGSYSCVTPAGVASPQVEPPPVDELGTVEIWRSTDENFNPVTSPTAPGTVKVGTASAGALSFNDTTAANCVNYYYRIRVVEKCADDAAKNVDVANTPGISVFDPPVGTPARKGRAESDVEPSQPGPLVVNNAVTASFCNAITNSCQVTMSWPEVKTDVTPSPVTIGEYDVRILQDGVLFTTKAAVVGAVGGASVAGGVVTYVATGLPKADLVALKDHVYTFSAAAKNCATVGAYSNTDTWPKCTFAGGSNITVGLSGIHGGAGTGDNPWIITGAETLTFSVPSPNKLGSVTGKIINVATNAQVGTDITSTTGAGTSAITVGWPDSGDEILYRFDYTVSDQSTPTACTRSGSVYIRETAVVCPIPVVSTPTFNLDSAVGAPFVSFPLNNTSIFRLTLAKAEITWNEKTADPDEKATVGPVTVPSSTGGTVNLSLTGNTTSSGIVTATNGGSAQQIFENLSDGSYVMKVTITTNGNKDLAAQPITALRVFYRLPGDTAGDTLRQCDVFGTP